MLKATFANLAALPRQHWGVCTLPTALADHLGVECTFRTTSGERWRAVRGKTAGCRTVFRVQARMAGLAVVEGEFLDEPHASACSVVVPHLWVTDDLRAVVPAFGVRVVNESLESRDFWVEQGQVDLIDGSPAHQRWRTKLRVPELGGHFVWWGDVLHADPVVPVWAKFVWSDRTDPRPNRTFQFFAIRTGEQLSFDYATKLGIPAALPMSDGRWLNVLNSESITMQDGAGIGVSGRMLTFEDAGSPHPADPGATSEDLANVRAGFQGPILGVSHDWDGYFLANHNLAHVRGGVPSTWAAYLQRQREYAGWVAERELGSAARPGQTGAQDDFGAVKGTEATVGHDPRHIYRLQEAAQAEILRGFNHYEANGEPLSAAAHPQWVTWSGVTHWHAGVSPDRLGKLDAAVAQGTGWVPHDDQHRSHNTVAAYLALSDNPLVEDQVTHLATVDEAAYRVRFPNYGGVDAARAQGRTQQALAQLASVVDPVTRARLQAVASARLGPIMNNPLLTQDVPLKVLSWGEPDPRKEIKNADGTRASWVSMWEHGLALVGLYVALKHKWSNELLAAILVVAETVGDFGCFQHGDTWYTVSDIIWRDGHGPAEPCAPGSRELVSAPHITDVFGWTFAGILVAREVLEGQHRLAPKLDAYVQAMTGGQDSPELVWAEWWAIVAALDRPSV